MEPGLSLARLQAAACMAWHGMGMGMGCFHTLTHSHTLTSLNSPLTTHTFLSPPFSSQASAASTSLPYFLLLALSCPALACTSLSLGSQPLPLELVGDFPPTISCPRAARHLRDPARITWLCSMPLQPAFYSHC